MAKHIQNTLEFVQSLQATKKAQQQWAELDHQQRLQICEQVVNQNSKLVLENPRWLEQYLRWQTEQNQTQLSKSDFASSGGIYFTFIEFEPVYRFTWERILPALLAGNAIYLQIDCSLPQVNLELLNLPESLVNICQLQDEDLQMAMSHPSIQAVSYVGNSWTEKLIVDSSRSLKKLQILGAAKNTALVFPGADLKLAAEGILKGATTFNGLSNLNIQKVLVTEGQTQELLQCLENGIQDIFFSPATSRGTGPLALRRELNSKALEQVVQVAQDPLVKRSSKANQAGFEIIHNLNNCSPWQQDPFAGPVLLINEVKYVHEMVKWVNTSYLGLLAQVWADAEKFAKFAPKLEVGQVLHNSWYERQVQAIQGVKQSAYGNMDFAWNGKFFSNVKILTN